MRNTIKDLTLGDGDKQRETDKERGGEGGREGVAGKRTWENEIDDTERERQRERES